MKIRFWIIFLIYFPIFAQTNAEFNKKGIDAFYNKDYAKAIEYFKKSINQNPNDPYANYNLACVYAVQMSLCEDMEEDSNIYKLLQTAVQNKPSYRETMLKDKDLKIIKDTFQFGILAGFDQKTIFTRITWYGPSPGAYGHIDQFNFDPKGTFVYTKKSFDDNDGKLIHLKYEGTYKWITTDTFQIKFKNQSPIDIKTNQFLKGKHTERILEIEGFMHHFSDSPDRCSA